jgi:hypothetical protein
MAGVRIRMLSFPGAGASPEYVDTDTFATPALAIAGIANGFLIVTPNANTSEPGDTPPIQALNVTNILTILQNTV